MYELKFEGYPIYDPRLDELLIWDATAHLAVDEAGSISFSINSSHPYISNLTKLKGRLELLSDGVPIFRGRIVTDTENLDLSYTVEAEGQLACLNDSIIAPFDFPGDYEEDENYQTAAESGNVVQFWLEKLLASHNSQVSDEQQIKLGTVTVSDPNNYIARSATDYATTWKTITSKLPGSALGGHLLVRYENDGTYLDYLSDYPLSNTQSVAFASNLLDFSDEINAAEIYTAILPVGADGLTISGLEDGDLNDDLVKEGTVIYSKSGVSKYGRITSVQNWEDVTEAANLRTKATERLAQIGVLPAKTIQATAVDLHFTDSEIAALRVGRYTPIVSAPHGLDARYVLSALDLNISDPGNTLITLGASVRTETDRTQGAINELGNTSNLQQIQINEQKSNLESLYQTTESRFTEVIQNSQEIIIAALEEYATTSDLESFKEAVSSQLSVLADQIELRFTETTEQIEDVNGDLQSRYNELIKYFRFTVDGIEIGEEGNTILLRVDNDRIGFYDGGLEVAYFTDKQLVITDAHFLNSLRIGNFAWVPRSTGNLSLVKVSD